jgi:hypothetical protein
MKVLLDIGKVSVTRTIYHNMEQNDIGKLAFEPLLRSEVLAFIALQRLKEYESSM